MSHHTETRLTKLKHMSHQAEKVRDMSHQAEKGDQALATWKEHQNNDRPTSYHYFEASKPVFIVAMKNAGDYPMRIHHPKHVTVAVLMQPAP